VEATVMPSVVALQTRPAFGEVDRNLAEAEAALGSAAPDLLVLPELCSTGYAFRDRAEARALGEPFPDGPTVRWLARASARTGGVAIGGFVERDGDRLWNAAAVCAAGRPVLAYRKVHLFGFEREVFDEGTGPFPVVEHAGLRVGVMICFDWRFPEAARTLALAGADLIAHPSNLVLPHAQRAMVTRALENGVWTVTANRVGGEHRPPRPPLTFTGRSVIVSPLGETVAEGAPDRPDRIEAVVDPALARDKRLPSGNHLLLDRRPSTYHLGGGAGS
jgi:predicted amidohydrolase